MPHKTSRHSPGEGSVTQRQDGRWQASLQVDGHRRTVYGKTRQEVVAKLEALKRQASQAGALPDPGKRTLNDLLEAWLEVKAPTLKERTLADYQEICQNYISPALGTLRLDKVTPDRIQRLCARWQRMGKARTALKCYRALAQALDQATQWGWLAHNPCERIEAPRYRPQRKTLWALDELQAFLAGTRAHWLYPFWLVAVSTGARVGELLALEWGDVDWEQGALAIRRSAQRLAGQRVVTGPKTLAGIRTITLPQEVLATLRDWRSTQEAQRLWLGPNWQGGDFIFTTPKGQPLSASTVEYVLSRECRHLGLPPMTPHGLRHLHASLLLAAGLPVPLVSKRLGHANPGVTMAIYAHALGKDDRAATEAIARALGPEGGATR